MLEGSTAYRLLPSARTLSLNHVTETFLLASCQVRSKQRLCFRRLTTLLVVWFRVPVYDDERFRSTFRVRGFTRLNNFVFVTC